MHNLGRTLARLGPARALLAGAAILAGAAGPAGSKANGQAEDVALAIPRLSAPGRAPRLGLPQPLPPSEASRVRRIFALQAKQEIPAAIAECSQLSDATLLPYILADRYLRGPNRATPEQLTAWLASHPDLPDAPAIYARLARQAPKTAARLTAPLPPPPLPSPAAAQDVDPTERLFARRPALDGAVRQAAATDPDRALRLIARASGLDRLYRAQLRAEVAQVLFAQGRDRQALATALAADQRTPGAVGLAPFVAGLASWRLDQPAAAARLFAAAFRSRLIQPGQRAGAAFWAARAHRRLQDADASARWLRRAAEDGRTFYGLLARRSLGQPLSPEPDLANATLVNATLAHATLAHATLGEADLAAIDATQAGHRAFALLQVGQDARAAAELLLLWAQARDQPGLTRSIILVARQAGLTTLARQLAALTEPAPLRLPARRLRPAGGFRTDPALLYALVRLESNFDPHAVSPAGARGLMQLMPATIGFILQGAGIRAPHDPAANLDLGQRYLLMLARYDLIGGDLIRLLAGYNAGPGSLARWLAAVRHDGDPLLFIESVPNDETRAYIPRALAYAWRYAAELNLPAPSLDELAAGAWPRFHRQHPPTKLARSQ